MNNQIVTESESSGYSVNRQLIFYLVVSSIFLSSLLKPEVFRFWIAFVMIFICIMIFRSFFNSNYSNSNDDRTIADESNELPIKYISSNEDYCLKCESLTSLNDYYCPKCGENIRS